MRMLDARRGTLVLFGEDDHEDDALATVREDWERYGVLLLRRDAEGRAWALDPTRITYRGESGDTQLTGPEAIRSWAQGRTR